MTETPSSEDTLWAGSPSMRNAWPSILAAGVCLLAGPALYVYGAGLLSLAVPALGGFVLGAAWVKLRMCRYSVTSQRIIAARGLLARSRVELELSDIRQLSLKQTFGQRLLGVGDVHLESAGGPLPELSIAGIVDPSGVLETIRKARLSQPKVAPPFPVQPGPPRAEGPIFQS